MNSGLNNTLVLLQQVSAFVSKKITRKIFIKNICLLLCLAVINSVQARYADTTAFNAAGAFFALSVADIEASSKWYSEKLGLRVTMHLPRQEKTAVTILEGGGLIVELIQNDDA